MEILFLSKANITTEIEQQVNNLFMELSNIEQINVRDLLSLSNPPYIVTCFDGEILVGMATMAIYEVISGRKGWIEDVIVSEKFRNKGIGERLTTALVDKAKELKLNTILLFSNPKREAAHRLYKRLGFTEKGSTLFNLNFE